MCVKLSFGYLNPIPYPPHSTSIYTYGVTTAPRVCGGKYCSRFEDSRVADLINPSTRTWDINLVHGVVVT